MASSARRKFSTIMERADLLSIQAGRIRKKIEEPTKTVLLHAALATQVAAWDAYVKAVTREYFSVTSNPGDTRFSAMHSLLKSQLDQELKKFNTPNSDNCRNLLLKYADFDPWPSWTHILFNGSRISASLVTRDTLDDILKVRHSFAHGFSIPAHSWNTSTSGTAILDCRILKETKRFLIQVCENTDRGLANHIKTQHGLLHPW